MNDYYANKLKQGLEYQDFVTEYLYSVGLPLITYTSKKYQVEKGENKLGVEIKFDNNYSRTGNLYIEVMERSNINYNYVDSGIFRKDNTWLYIQGNYNKAFVFFKIQLQGLSKRYNMFEIKNKTSKGFLLSEKELLKICGKVLTFK